MKEAPKSRVQALRNPEPESITEWAGDKVFTEQEEAPALRAPTGTLLNAKSPESRLRDPGLLIICNKKAGLALASHLLFLNLVH